MKSITRSIASTIVVYIVYRTVYAVYTTKQYTDQKAQHELLKCRIREFIKCTEYEYFYDQYDRILTSTFMKSELDEYCEIINNITFILNQPIPKEFILRKLETYMIILDELYDLKISKKLN